MLRVTLARTAVEHDHEDEKRAAPKPSPGLEIKMRAEHGSFGRERDRIASDGAPLGALCFGAAPGQAPRAGRSDCASSWRPSQTAKRWITSRPAKAPALIARIGATTEKEKAAALDGKTAVAVNSASS